MPLVLPVLELKRGTEQAVPVLLQMAGQSILPLLKPTNIRFIFNIAYNFTYNFTTIFFSIYVRTENHVFHPAMASTTPCDPEESQKSSAFNKRY